LVNLTIQIAKAHPPHNLRGGCRWRCEQGLPNPEGPRPDHGGGPHRGDRHLLRLGGPRQQQERAVLAEMETLARRLSRSPRTIQRHLHLLKERGLVEFVERRRDGRGRFGAYLYRVLHVTPFWLYSPPRPRKPQLRRSGVELHELPRQLLVGAAAFVGLRRPPGCPKRSRRRSRWARLRTGAGSGSGDPSADR
jgi:DNA-binding transcriptional ArsR family regulator